jgi:hypothetical protein
MQCFYNRRGKFTTKAVNTVAAFFKEHHITSKSDEDIKSHAEYVAWTLGPGLLFMFVNGDPKV